MFESVLSNRELWEQPFIDLWSVPHLLSGVLIAVAFLLFARSLVSGFLFAGAVAFAWEIFEHVMGISTVEVLSNIIVDIFILPLGFLAVVPFRAEIKDGTHRWVIGLLALVLISTTFLGWLSYQYYAM